MESNIVVERVVYMNKKIGFIGCGNMAKAMIGGMIKSGLTMPQNIYASDPSKSNLEEMKNSYGIKTTLDNTVLAGDCDIVFLSVKPDIYSTVIEEIKEVIKPQVIIVIIAAGQTLAQNEERFEKNIKMVKAMPNTPSFVGEGMTSVITNHLITQQEKEEVKDILGSFGRVEFINENLIDAATAVAGSSPAYVYMFIEALADGGVIHGMPRNQAYTFAAQAVLGAAKMVLETGIHPGELKDRVCSPGGATIDAVACLEESGFRNSVIKAVNCCVKKIGQLS